MGLNLYRYPLWLTSSKAILFVVISIIVMLLLTIHYWVAFYYEEHQAPSPWIRKLFKRSYLPYIAFILAVVIGLVFASLKHFQNLYINTADLPNRLSPTQAWSWQAVSFGSGFGEWIIAVVFLAFLWATPTLMYVSVRRIMLENNSWQFFVKKAVWTLVIVGVTVGVMMLLFVMHFNQNDTSLQLFNLNKQLDDGFYYTSRWLFHHAFLTFWYPIFFILYIFAWLITMWIINFLELRHGKKIIFDTWLGKLMLRTQPIYKKTLANFPRSQFVVNSALTPLSVFGWMALLDLFSYLTSFIVFNAKAPFTHLMFIGNLAIIFVVLMVITFTTGLVVHRRHPKRFLRAFGIIYRNHSFRWLKTHLPTDPDAEQWLNQILKKNGQTSLNMCQELVAGVSFTIFLGFTNFTQFSAYDQVGTTVYSLPFHTAYYWLSLLVATFMVNYMFVDIRQQIFLTKISIGAAAYHVTPGMQSGWLNFLGQWMTFNSTIIDDQIRLLM